MSSEDRAAARKNTDGTGAFALIAEVSSAAFSGEIASRTFTTLEAAEAQMRRWARFGVDCYCNEADVLRIVDTTTGANVRTWSWRRRRPVKV